MKAKITSLFFLLYSLLMTVVSKIIPFISRRSKNLRDQTTGRQTISDLANSIHNKRKAYKNGVVFFCSSAGEFEQAKPLIHRLEARGDTFVHTFLFSKSGYEYAMARNDQTNFCLSPLTDSVWDWGWIFAAARPNLVAVVRHELWPGFIWSAKNYGQVFLIDASRSLGEAKSWLKKIARKNLLMAFSKIYAVSEQDQMFFTQSYGIPRSQMTVTGDTKYDRVIERAKSSSEKAHLSHSVFSRVMAADSERPFVLTMGSAHPADLEVLLLSYLTDASAFSKWKIVIAPHHIDAANIETFENRLKEVGIESIRLSAIEKNPDLKPHPVVLLDSMGRLAEAYQYANAAFVGGASHYQVHNVLEPAVQGLSLAWGSRFRNSQEAVYLVDHQIASVVTNDSEFLVWLKKSEQVLSGADTASAQAVRKLAGASDIIMNDWSQILDGR